MNVETIVQAESVAQAQFILRHLFGKDAIVSLNQVNILEYTTEDSKVLSPEELQIKSMKERSKKMSNDAKKLALQYRLKKLNDAS